MYEPSTEPHHHQRQALRATAKKESAALFLEMGLGKTKVVLDTAGYLHSQGSIQNLLVTAPNGVHRQWVEEQAPIHLSRYPWAGTWFETQRSTTKKWQRELKKVFEFEGLRIFTINVESVITPKGEQFVRDVLKSGATLWALDESVTIKTPGAKRTKRILKLSQMATHRRILSGLPVTKGIEDLYTQYRFLDERILGHRSFYSFRHHYCITAPIPGAPAGAVRIVGYRNTDELLERVRDHTVRFTAEDCLDLPERIYMRREVPLTKEQAQVYDQLKNEFFYELGDSIVTAEQAIVRLLRLQQVLGGHLRLDDGSEQTLPSKRIDVLKQVLEEIDGKVVIWARFHHDIDTIRTELRGQGLVKWDGRTVGAERARAKEQFLMNPDVRIFLANPQAAGMGLDGLQHISSAMIYYSNSFNLSDRVQSEARLHRHGQRGTVRVIDLVTPKTIDDLILKALRAKREVSDLAMNLKPDDL